MAAIFQWVPLLLRRRKRDAMLQQAAAWPVIEAKLLKSIVLEKDPLAEGGTTFQDRQIESAFYFTLPQREGGSYFGGHLRSVPLSDSEAHRMLRQLPEDMPVRVRYNPDNPDQNVTLPVDNPQFPTGIWPM
jgi:hypothetical protein